MEKPASTWSFDQGTLTVHYLDKTVSLGRYAHARIRCEGSCGVLRQAPSEKEALGFAARKLRRGHALEK
jgi:hypothetical protein